MSDTVDVANATWTNTIGDPELGTVWTDLDFDPTPRWTAYDQVRFGIKMSSEAPMTQQERAWSSPIWFTP